MIDNTVIDFTNAMLNAGIVTNDTIIDDGQLHRFHVQGDKRGTKNGAYILYNDGKPNGWFQHFSAGITGKWTASGKSEPLSGVALNKRSQSPTLFSQKPLFLWLKGT